MKQNNEQPIEQLLKENEQLKLQLEESNGRLQWLEEQFKLLQQFRFGVKSEKLVDGQLNLFNDAEETSDETVIEPTYEEVNNYKRRKDKRSKEDLMKDLPVETIEYTLDEADRLCPH